MSKDFGGRISLRFSTGALISLRGTVTLYTAGQSNEAVTNQNGTVDRVGTPMPYRAEITFADSGLDHAKLMTGPRFNVTIDEDFTGVTHYFTDAFVSGEPQINRINGEVSGVTIVSSKYRRREG